MLQPRRWSSRACLVEELLVRQRQDGAVIVRLEVDGDQQFALGRALPGPREDQLAVGHDLAIDAADAVMLVRWASQNCTRKRPPTLRSVSATGVLGCSVTPHQRIIFSGCVQAS